MAGGAALAGTSTTGRSTLLCPGHKGKTPCSDGGVRMPRKNGKHRPLCAKHFPMIQQEARLRKNIQDFFNSSGVDLSNQQFVDKLSSPPPRRILARPVRPRTETPTDQDKNRQIDNLTHKLVDTRSDYNSARKAQQQLARKIRRLSDTYESTLTKQRLDSAAKIDAERLASAAKLDAARLASAAKLDAERLASAAKLDAEKLAFDHKVAQLREQVDSHIKLTEKVCVCVNLNSLCSVFIISSYQHPHVHVPMLLSGMSDLSGTSQ